MYKFERYEQKIDSLEAQVESYDLGKKTLKDEFAELASSDKIDNELAELKAKMLNKMITPEFQALSGAKNGNS